MNAFYGGIHGPVGKADALPSSEVHFLKMSAHRHTQERPDEVVRLPQEFVENSPLLAKVGGVALATQILNHLAGIERKLDPLTFHPHMLEGILQVSDRDSWRYRHMRAARSR